MRLNYFIITLSAVFFIYLAVENAAAARARKKIKHIVHVNGTRGKSSVTRMIYAGLRAGGIEAFAKTTGTLPLMLDTQGREIPVRRHGRANIREQVSVMKKAAAEGAEVLVIECMAISPALIKVSQNRMLEADVGVITNARPDHADVMGAETADVAAALFNTVPQRGVCFTADPDIYDRLREECGKRGCAAELAVPPVQDFGFDFAENVELALRVCEWLNVERKAALEGIRHYRRDPYALSLHILKNGALVVGGLSVNDPTSTVKAFQTRGVEERFAGRRLTMLINNRADRLFRAAQMLDVVTALRPQSVWLLGSAANPLKKAIIKSMPECAVIILKKPEDVPLDNLNEKDALYAVGNVADGGVEFMELVRKESASCTTI